MNPLLSHKQGRFVDEYLVDCNGAAAAVRAGYAPGSAKVAASRLLTSDNPVRLAIQGRQEADAVRLGVTREGVIQRFLEAFELAKLNAEPAVMVAAARELGRLLGFYAPARVEVVVDGEGLATDGRWGVGPTKKWATGGGPWLL
jgi:phage terminase small subunit